MERGKNPVECIFIFVEFAANRLFMVTFAEKREGCLRQIYHFSVIDAHLFSKNIFEFAQHKMKLPAISLPHIELFRHSRINTSQMR